MIESERRKEMGTNDLGKRHSRQQKREDIATAMTEMLQGKWEF